nr:TIGR04100 family radical SAM protein [uncultured Merdimonas sp.]
MKHTAMTILYELHDNLYVNLTNRCPCSCTFCLRQNRQDMGTSDSLWLEHEPSFEEVTEEFEKFDMDRYKEVVFCGFGEPTEALDVLLKTARFVKDHYQKPVRINTNGLGNLIHGRDITPSFEGLIDTLSISLNTPDPEKYLQIVRPKFGEASHDAMLEFAKSSKKYVPNVVLTTVSTTLTSEEEEQCRQICQNLGVTYRIRPFEN